MARIKLTMPEKILTTIKIPVRITDLNYGNHVGNDAMVSIIHEARMAWLSENGYSELDAAGTSLIMGDLAVEYKKESKYGDTLTVAVAAGETTRLSFELYYRISNQNGQLVAIAKTGLVCYDYELGKTSQLTEGLKKILGLS